MKKAVPIIYFEHNLFACQCTQSTQIERYSEYVYLIHLRAYMCVCVCVCVCVEMKKIKVFKR